MVYKKLTLFILALFVMHLNVNLVKADDPIPSWMQEALKRQTPSFEVDDVPALVLHDEQSSTLDSDGRLTITSSLAVRILRREGKAYAEGGATYLQSSSKVKEFRAWLVRPNGSVKFFGKDAVIDRISDPDDIYNEYREKFVSAAEEAEPGSVFGYQSVVEERPLFTQDIWAFQGRLPTAVSRYTLNLPTGWIAKSTIFNHSPLEPTVNGSSYTWELQNLGPIPPEPASPSVRNMAPRIAINYFPADPNGMRIFANWQDVSRWGTEMHDPSVTLDDAVAGKARDLTANAKSELEKIKAIANFVQNLQYISVDIGVGSGNGYRPRAANLVLQRGYGDCKDKANLMRTMLKALKIEAFPVFIYSGDPAFVREEWVSPSQFNHCILAIRVSESSSAASIVIHPTLGRLLIFDATDPYTMVGDLPDHEQGSFALVAAGSDGNLMKMPVLSPDLNRLERDATVELDEMGNVTGIIRESSKGQAATAERARLRSLSTSEYNTMLESWITRGISGAKILKTTQKDNTEDGKFDLEVQFAAKSYAQLMQGKLMVFKPAVIGRLDRFTFSDSKRLHPYLINSMAYAESIKIKLPVGFEVDEMPDPAKFESGFGKYSVTYEVKDGYLLFSRSMTLSKTTVPADKYYTVSSFFAKIRNADQSPVVLVKK